MERVDNPAPGERYIHIPSSVADTAVKEPRGTIIFYLKLSITSRVR